MATIDQYQLNDRFLADEGTVFLTGIQALARLPLEQLRTDRLNGLNTASFISGYQGSPLGGYGDAVARAARLAPELPVVFKQGMNEEYGATAVMGSQLASVQPDCRYDGIVGIWYGKAPGVDRAADALRHAVYAGTSMNGGAVAIVGDDPAAKSSTVPSSSAGVVFDMHMPLLYPGDPVEALKLGRHAIAMSRATGLWVALKIVADVADATASMHLNPGAFDPVMPLIDGQRYQHRPDGRLLTPHTIELEREIVEVRYELARRYAYDNKLNYLTTDPVDAWIGIASSGITYREVREALSRLGLSSDAEVAAAGIRLLKMGMPMPFNTEMMRNFARGLREVLVVEEKQPNIESLVKDALYDLSARPQVFGKVDESGALLFPAYGALDADIIMPLLRARLEGTIGDRLVPEKVERQRTLIPVGGVERSPFFCSGCPHNRSTEVPDGALIGAGIGCHTMTLLMDPERVGDIAGITCMGNEGTQWIGMSDFVERDHMFQNLGDGTYFHSGQLAIQAAVAGGVNITYKLLYNGTVAMTGGQDPEGQLPVPAICRALQAQGVARVLITTEDVDRYKRVDLPKSVDVWDRKRLIEAQEELAAVPGVTVLIHDQYCAAEARRDRKRGTIETPNQRVVINHRLCEGCGDCGQVSNCLSVQPVDTAFGRKTHIDQTTCNLDYSCLEGDCPSFMTITVDPDAPAEQTPVPSAPTDLPEPVLVVPADDFAMRITGIGGTGVVTVAQVLGTAAMLDGFEVRGLDQIGLSQKAGPVVSDIRLSRLAPTATSRLGEGQADLLLAFDQLVAASDKGLLTADREATTVVGSTTGTPTGAMITHLEIEMPEVSALADHIASVTRSDVQHWADAQAITQDLFGSTTTANIFVVGMAVQAGCLPIAASSVEAAIELNAVAVEANLDAFRWGRCQVADSARVEAAQVAVDPPPIPVALTLSAPLRNRVEQLRAPDLSDELRMFASELVAWGDESTAEGWLSVLERVAVVEQRVGGTALLRGVAANLYKLTAYKDEYEVARLMLDTEGQAEAREIAGSTGKVAWKLHPPMLRALGMDSKISIDLRAEKAISLLAKGKRLRGSRFDPFGRPKVRRVERELVAEYVAAIDQVLGEFRAENVAAAVALAELPDMVRGYEDIKLANVDLYRTALKNALAAIS
jgi:indolepyruvate ferredoxin oxidoreductase